MNIIRKLRDFMGWTFEDQQPRYLCHICFRPHWIAAQALQCIASHPVDVPPTNEDR